MAARAPGRGSRHRLRRTATKKILLLLRNHCGVDFSLYKSTTIQRRITRRTVLSKHDTVEDYAQVLRGNAKELDALYSDCLISVTSFFRNPETFELLQRKVFPRLLQQRERDDRPVRVWVLGWEKWSSAHRIKPELVKLRPISEWQAVLDAAHLDLSMFLSFQCETPRC